MIALNNWMNLLRGMKNWLCQEYFHMRSLRFTSDMEEELQDEKGSMLELITRGKKEYKEPSDKIRLEQSLKEGCLLEQIEELENEKQDIKVTNKNEIDMLRICLDINSRIHVSG